MIARVAVLVALCGCRQLFGIGDPVLAGDATSDGVGDTSTFDGPSAPPAFVQAASNLQGGSTSQVSAQFPVTLAAHDLVVVAIGFLGSQLVTAVSDSAGNQYTLVTTTRQSSVTLTTYYAADIVAPTTTTTVTAVLDSAVNGGIDIRIAEYAGIARTSPLEGYSSAGGTSITCDSGAFMTSRANELLVGANTTVSGTTMAGAGYTQRALVAGDILEDRLVASAGIYHATASEAASTEWTMQVLAFRP